MLAIASGNTLRRDDGVAHHALSLLEGIEKLAVLQLYPELSHEIAQFDAVFFLDADASGGAPRIEPVGHSPLRAPLSHGSSAEEIVLLARSLYGFTGSAWLCRIPVDDFDYGEGLSLEARQCAQRAVALIVGQIAKLRPIGNLPGAGSL